MGNLLTRIARPDASRLPLRARLDAVKAGLAAGKAGLIAAVNRILPHREPKPAPAVPRGTGELRHLPLS